jgi:RecA/RadA recombinase
MPTLPKAALEQLLEARRLQHRLPPLRGQEPRSLLVPTGIAPLDNLVQGVPRGQLSEISGPASSGRTGVALALVARATAEGLLVAWIDPGERFDPGSAAAGGADLTRLLWLRGRSPQDSLSAAATLLDASLFEAIVLDFASAPPVELRRLPGSTWIRLQRRAASTRTAVLLLASEHLAVGPGGLRVQLQPARPRWSGRGPGRLLRGLDATLASGRHALVHGRFTLHAL